MEDIIMAELYLEDCYIKEFDAVVESVKDDKFVVLDKTAFYPNSGGQPHDLGVLIKDETEYLVDYVGKFSGKISHEVTKPGLKVGDKVKGVIDWNRRYKFMRYHTACHVLSAVIHKETGAKITGNQIGVDKTRVDFSLENFDRGQIKSYQDKVNKIINQEIPVNIKILSREDAFKIPDIVKLKMDFPESVKEIRIIELENLDMQACGGTHVRNTAEIGPIEIIKAENKGKNNRRIYFKI